MGNVVVEQWWNTQFSVYIVPLTNQSLNCMYLFSFIQIFFLKLLEQKKNKRRQQTCLFNVSKLLRVFLFTFLSLIWRYTLFCKGKGTYYLSSHLFSKFVTRFLFFLFYFLFRFCIHRLLLIIATNWLNTTQIRSLSLWSLVIVHKPIQPVYL